MTTSLPQIRQDLGVCPQFNVLFEHLTVAEHLWFFASLKQTPPERVMEEVESFMKNVGLADKADSYARELSGLYCFLRFQEMFSNQ